MAEARSPNPLVEQFRHGGVPRELRLMAAQGLLPLKPSEVVELLHFLLGDKATTVREAAAATLAGLPADDMLAIFTDRQTPPQVLAWGVSGRPESALREASLQNPETPDQAIEEVAGRLPEALAELVVINQVRLLRRTSLLEALEVNPDLNKDQKRRLMELRETFRIGQPEPASPAPSPPVPAPVEVLAMHAASLPETTDDAATAETEWTPASEEEAVSRYLTEDERRETEKVSAVQRLYRLNTAEKVVTALKGTREERAILIRDPNRLVAAAVLGSPRMTDTEVEAFAAMKSLSDETLRKIGSHKEWTKRYGVISSLVKNPRTPLAISLTMVSRLTPKDIKSVAVDRNVPEVVRKQAQKFVKGAQEKR